MDYTLTRIDPNGGENDRYPLQKQEIVSDPLELGKKLKLSLSRRHYSLDQ